MFSSAESRTARLMLMAILGLYLVVGSLYAIYTPPWQIPDEPAHYNYIRHIVETGALPVLTMGDYDQAYLSELTSTGFPSDKPIDSLRYENHQPPLYYLLAAPIFLTFDGALLPLRLFSVAIGAGVLVFTYLAVLRLFPGRPALALTAVGFIAFVPQHVAMMAGVNNDGLAELWIAVGMWLALKDVGGTHSRSSRLGLGLVIGAAFVTKATTYALAAVAVAVWPLEARRHKWTWTQTLLNGAGLFLPALIVGALWWGRDIAVYGWPDILGLQRHAAVVIGQPRTAEWLAELGWLEFSRRFVVTTFRSFWGQFGWMGVVMDARVYWTLFAFSAALIVGFAVAVRRLSASITPAQHAGLVLLALLAILVGALYLYYNLTFVQHQGRYLFPALIPIGLAAGLGLTAWSEPMRFLGAARRWLPLVAVALMAALDVFALFHFIVPALPRNG